MPKFKVVVVDSRTETWEVEAENHEHAEEIVIDGPHSEAKLVDVREDFYTDDVEEI